MKKYISLIIFFSFTGICLHGQNDLSYFLQQAKANSPLIQDSKNQAEANSIELERIRALYTKAQVTFNAAIAVSPIINRDNEKNQLQISPSDAQNYSGYDIAASNGGVYQGMLNVSQPIFNSGKLRMASEQSMVAGMVNNNAIKVTAHDLEKTVGDQYILCLQDLKQISYSEELVHFITEQKNIVTKFVQNGLLKQSDLLLVIIEEQNQQNLLSSYRSTYKRDLLDLNTICGINDTNLILLKDVDFSFNSGSNSGFTERFRLDSLNLRAAQATFELKYKPQLTAFVNLGLNGVYVPTLPNRFGASAGLNFSVFIFDGKQKSLNRKKTDVLLRSTQSYRSNLITQNTVRKNRIISEINSLNERVAVSESQIRNYRELLKLYRSEVSSGQQSVTTYILTLKNFGALQRDLALLQTNKQLLLNSYNYWNW